VTLVLLAPIGLDGGVWDELALPTGEVVRHVLPGFGGRPRAPERPTMASLADELAGRLDGPADVAGCSLGAMVALHLAVRHPECVRSLLLACAGPCSDPRLMAERAADAVERGMGGVLEVTLERWLTPELLALAPPPRAVRYAREQLLALDPEAFADGWRAIATHDLGPPGGDRGAGHRARGQP